MALNDVMRRLLFCLRIGDDDVVRVRGTMARDVDDGRQVACEREMRISRGLRVERAGSELAGCARVGLAAISEVPFARHDERGSIVAMVVSRNARVGGNPDFE